MPGGVFGKLLCDEWSICMMEFDGSYLVQKQKVVEYGQMLYWNL